MPVSGVALRERETVSRWKLPLASQFAQITAKFYRRCCEPTAPYNNGDLEHTQLLHKCALHGIKLHQFKFQLISAYRMSRECD